MFILLRTGVDDFELYHDGDRKVLRKIKLKDLELLQEQIDAFVEKDSYVNSN